MKSKSGFLPFVLRVIILHTTTYFLFGLLMSNLFNYKQLFSSEIFKVYMRPYNSLHLVLGPLVQPLRGLLFAVAIWPFKELILQKKLGWLYLWNLFVVFSILSTAAAAPSSIEGVLYTNIPIRHHLLGLPEMLLQTLAFSLLTVFWEKQIKKKEQTTPVTGPKSWVEDLVQAVILASFAYIGYVVSSISIALASRAKINFSEAGRNLTLQLMFVAAFVANIIVIFSLRRLSRRRSINIWFILGIFTVVDIFIPYIYQSIFLSRPPFHVSILIGILPAIIITIGIYASGLRKSSRRKLNRT